MKKRIVLTSILFVFILSGYSQTWKVEWNREYKTSQMNCFVDVVETSDRGFTAFGAQIQKEGNLCGLWLLRLNEKGDTLWTKSFANGFKETPKKLVKMHDGGYLLIASRSGDTSENLYLIRTDDLGKPVWEKIFDSGLIYTGEDAIALSSGGFVLVGSKKSVQNSESLWMAEFDDKGDAVWEKLLAQGFTGCCKSVKQLPEGGFAVTGTVLKKGKQQGEMWLARTKPNGEALWETKIPSGDTNLWPECLCCSPDSCFIAVGWQGTCLNGWDADEPIVDYDLLLVKLDCKGKVLWKKAFDREGSEGGNAVLRRPDGNFVVAGVKATSFLGKVGPWLMLVDPQGNMLSETLIPFHFNSDQAIKVINSSDSGVVVIGPGFRESLERCYGWMMKFTEL